MSPQTHYLLIFSRDFLRESMERETGIEPATNGLEGRDSTTELLPLEENGGGGWIRTTVGLCPADLQSAAIDRSATPPCERPAFSSTPTCPSVGAVPGYEPRACCSEEAGTEQTAYDLLTLPDRTARE